MDNNALVSGFDNTTNDNLKITLSAPDGLREGLVITLNGYIDIYTSAFFQAQIEKIMGAGFINLIFDCKNLDYVSSTGIGVFSSLLKNIKLQSNRLTKLENFLTDDTYAEVSAHTCAPLFVFR
mgnify:CR=1 FL=1